MKLKLSSIFFIILLLNCSQKFEIKVENSNKKYIIKNMPNTDRIILTIKSSLKNPANVKIVISDVTDDYSDMPIFSKEFKVYKGMNYINIKLSEIGINKFGLRIYHKNKLIDYRIIEVIP